MFWKWKARLACHHTKWCCQYVDRPLCNLSKDPHWDARVRYLRRSRIEQKEEEAWQSRHQAAPDAS